MSFASGGNVQPLHEFECDVSGARRRKAVRGFRWLQFAGTVVPASYIARCTERTVAFSATTVRRDREPAAGLSFASTTYREDAGSRDAGVALRPLAPIGG